MLYRNREVKNIKICLPRGLFYGIVFQRTEMGLLTHFYDVDYWSVPIQSMPRFAQVSASVTVRAYFVYSRIVSLLGLYIGFLLYRGAVGIFAQPGQIRRGVPLCHCGNVHL